MFQRSPTKRLDWGTEQLAEPLHLIDIITYKTNNYNNYLMYYIRLNASSNTILFAGSKQILGVLAINLSHEIDVPGTP